MHRLNEEKECYDSAVQPYSGGAAADSHCFRIFLSKGRLLEEITAAQLEERCADCIIIRVVEADTERYAAQLERFFPEARYRVLAG